MATSACFFILQRAKNEGLTEIEVDINNRSALLDLYFDGGGKNMGVAEPDIGIKFDIETIFQMCENANYNSGCDIHGIKQEDIDDEDGRVHD
jgi:hypothetical protein